MQLNLTDKQATALQAYIKRTTVAFGRQRPNTDEVEEIAKVIEAAMAPKLYTVIWTEIGGNEWPLIHTIEVSGDLTEEKVTRLVAIQWMHDTCDDPHTEERIAEVMKQVWIHFAYAGDIKTVEDWRS